jgi:hypothetical protein
MDINIFDFCKNETFNKDIQNLIKQIDLLIFNKNNLISKRTRDIDFYDLFYYLLFYNSDINATHSESILNYNSLFKNNLSQNSFINRLSKINPIHFKNINDSLVLFYYEYFDIKNKNLSTDGSLIALLNKYNKNYMSNNNRYCKGYINSIVDNENCFPVTIDLFTSSNEIENLKTQLNYVNKNDIIIMDRGYESYDLINYFLENNIYFIMRIPKSNNLSKLINNDIEKNNNLKQEINVEYLNNNINQKYNLKIIKYNNKEKIKHTETLCDLEKLIDDNNIIINEKNILKTKNKQEMTKLKTEKQEIKNIIKNTNDKKEKKKNNEKLTANICKIKKNKEKKEKLIKEIDEIKKENSLNIKKKSEILNFELSNYYLVTNKIMETSIIKETYKKRWISETMYKYEKDNLKMRNFENKNINMLKQNIYIIQFILIIVAFIKKIFNGLCKQDYYFNTKTIITSLNKYLFPKIFKFFCIKEDIKKNNNIKKKSINYKKNNKDYLKRKIIKKSFLKKLLEYLYHILKDKIKKVIKKTNPPRIKKRPSTQWSYLLIT